MVHAKQERLFSGEIFVQVLQRDGRYEIRAGAETPITSDNPEWVTLYLHELINFRVAWHLRDLIKIHAASGSLQGRRFMLAGEKGAGKTTLATRLLFEGADIHGDETVVIHGEEVTPLPRRFHLKEGTLPLVPQVIPICQRLTSYPAYHGGRFFFFDPTDAGFEWQIIRGTIDTVFYLEPRHGEKTDIERCPDWRMAEKLLLQSADFAADPEAQIGELCRLVQRSDNFVIHLGELGEAIKLIQDMLA